MDPKVTVTDTLQQVWQNRQANDGFVRVGPAVRAFIKAHSLDHPSPLAALGRIWRELVGPELSEHSRVAGFRRGALFIEVDSAAHRAELQTLVRAGLAAEITERLSQRPVSAIRLRLGHRQTRGRGAGQR